MSSNAWIGPVLLFVIGVVLGIRRIYGKFGWKPAVTAAVPVVLIAALIVSVALQARRLTAFASFSDRCTAASDTSSRLVLEARPINGKFVPFYEGGREASYEVFVRLPGRLRAETPNQLGAVVCIRPDVNQVGNYQPSNAPAFVRIWHVKVVHSSTRQVVATTTLRGSAPPKSTPKGRTGYGSKPFDELSAFLAALQTNPTP
jgi:hypothetical protein